MKFKELLLLAKVGDETAITAFIEHYKPMLIKSSSFLQGSLSDGLQ